MISLTADRPPRRRSDTSPTPAAPVVDIYVRLSRNPDGDLEKLDVQEADCRAVAQRRGWTVGVVHRDNSLSAWKRSVRRPGWEAMLDRAKNHQVDGVIAWHTDRLLRQPRDLETLIDIGARDGLLVASAYGEHDLSNSDHRVTMRIQAAMAAKSSDDTSRRIRRRFETKRENGMTTGGARPFGFPGSDRTAPKDPETGTRPAVPAEQVERERVELTRAAEEVAAGLPVARIVARWNAEGLLTATGATWSAVTLRGVLTRGRNAGLVEHEGQTVGRAPEDAIYSEELHSRVCAVFASRRRGRPNSGRYLASGLVHCANCGHRMSGRPAGSYRDGSPRTQYVCVKGAGGCGTVAADGRGLDDLLRAFAVDRLADPMHAARLNARIAQSAERREEIAAELDGLRTLNTALGDRLGRGEIDLDTFDAAVGPLRTRMSTLEAERDALVTDEPDTAPEGDREALAEEWEGRSVEDRRGLLTSALRGYRVTVSPATSRGAFDPERVAITPV